MFKNLRLGIKLGLGFGCLILIAITLGSVAIINMYKVSEDSERLSAEYVPEVAIANDLERSAMLTMYSMRGYSFSESEMYWDESKKELEKVKINLSKAQVHAERYPKLIQLKKDVAEASKGVDQYSKVAEESHLIISKMADIRKEMDQSTSAYMKSCADFLIYQATAMSREIDSGSESFVLSERLRKITLVNDIIDLGNDVRVKNFKSQATRDPEVMRAALDNFSKMESDFSELSKITKKDLNIAQIEKTKRAANEYESAMKQYLDNFLKLQELNKMRDAAAKEVLSASKGTAVAGVSATQSTANSAMKALGAASRIMIVGLCVALLLGIVIATILTKMITGPVMKGVVFAKHLSEGDLTQTIDVYQKDEIGILAEALRRMKDQLTAVVSDVQSATDNVASGSEELSTSSESLSQGATEQAASIEEVASSIEEMAANISQNANNAQKTDDLSTRAASMARESGVAVSQTVEAMKSIAEKISIIEEIARQTNLLALNAAIEAARAGEHGKGFAVVAAEVRKLAERSGTAATEISELSSNSVEIAEKAGEMLNQLVPDIEMTASFVQEISAASNEQNTGASQIAQAINQLDTVIQQNASASEEMASTSEELSGQAQQLQITISFFKVGDDRMSISTHSRRPAKMALQSVNSAKINTSVNFPAGVELEMDNGFEKF